MIVKLSGIKDKYWQYYVTMQARLMPRFIVVEAQVVSKPDKNGVARCHAEITQQRAESLRRANADLMMISNSQ